MYGFYMILTVNCYNFQFIFVMVNCCFLCGTDWILKFYLDELRL
jgi:hypothetical protein